MYRFIKILLMLIFSYHIIGCSHTYYLSKPDQYQAMIDSLADSNSGLEAKIDGKFYKLTSPPFYGNKVYYKLDDGVEYANIDQVEEIQINRNLNTTVLLLSSSLIGMTIGGIVGASVKEAEHETSGFFIFRGKPTNVLQGIIIGGAVGLTIGAIIDLTYKRTDSIAIEENK